MIVLKYSPANDASRYTAILLVGHTHQLFGEGIISKLNRYLAPHKARTSLIDKSLTDFKVEFPETMSVSHAQQIIKNLKIEISELKYFKLNHPINDCEITNCSFCKNRGQI